MIERLGWVYVNERVRCMGKRFSGVLLVAWMGMQSATACETLLPQFTYRYDDTAQTTYASNGYNQQAIQLNSGYKEVVQQTSADRVLRFGSDGVHAYFFEKPIIGASDYASLSPILNGSMAESHRYGWRYYQDRTAYYAAEDTGSQVVLHRLAPRKSEVQRLAQGILIVGDQAFSEQQKLPFKGSHIATQHVQEDFYLISDGKATYAPTTLAHNEVDEWQTWYGQLGWVKIANLPELTILGSIENIHFECGETHYLYDVIYDIQGKIAVNQNLTSIASPVQISPPAKPTNAAVSGSSLDPFNLKTSRAKTSRLEAAVPSPSRSSRFTDPFTSPPTPSSPSPSVSTPTSPAPIAASTNPTNNAATGRDELLFNFTPYLFRYRLIPTIMAEQAGIALKSEVQSALYSDRYQLFLGGHEYELKGY